MESRLEQLIRDGLATPARQPGGARIPVGPETKSGRTAQELVDHERGAWGSCESPTAEV